MSLFGPPNIKNLQERRDVNGLFKALNYQKDVRTRELAAAALGELGITLAVEPLAAALKDPSVDVRKAAASALGAIGDVRAVEPLFQALKENTGSISLSMAEAIKRFRDAHTIELAIAALKDQKFDVRYYAVEILAQIGDRSAVEPLIAAHVQEDPLPWKVGHAEEALEKICAANIIEPLLNALKDEEPNARRIAVKLLWKTGGVRVVDPFIAALKDRSAPVRHEAVRALDSLGWKPDKDENGAYYWATKHEWDECMAIGTPAVEPLLKIFDSSEGSDRLIIADVLVRLGWQPDKSVVEAYAWAKKHRWDKCLEFGQSAIEPLSYCLEDSSLPFRQRFLIAQALIKLGQNVDLWPMAGFPQLYEQIILILDSQKEPEKKRMEIQSLVMQGYWATAFVKIEFCKCGYPIVGVCKDGSKGPIIGVVYFKGGDSYTTRYYCPSCDYYITTVTQ